MVKATATLENVGRAIAIVTVDTDGDNQYALMAESAYKDIEHREDIFAGIWALGDDKVVICTTWKRLAAICKERKITLVDTIAVIAY